jgi:4-amino-4-deoxy-L-arabinose transferase-like glycosyltransferase
MRRAILFFAAAIALGVVLPWLVPDSFSEVGIELPNRHSSSSPPAQWSISVDTIVLVFRVIGVGFALLGMFALLWFLFGSRRRGHR